MLEFQVKEMMKGKGVKSLYTKLIKAGMSYSTAQGFMTAKRDSWTLKQMQILCKLAMCTPNDLLAWTPDSKAEDYPENPLQALRKKPAFDLDAALQKLTVEEIRERLG